MLFNYVGISIRLGNCKAPAAEKIFQPVKSLNEVFFKAKKALLVQ